MGAKELEIGSLLQAPSLVRACGEVAFKKIARISKGQPKPKRVKVVFEQRPQTLQAFAKL